MANAYNKPYTFRAGTPAKSAEVNANFDTLKDFVNELLTIFQEQMVAQQPYNKAYINGNDQQIFKAAEDTSASNANSVVINSQLDTTNTRVAALESRDTWTPPDYDNQGVLLQGSGTIANSGLLYVINADESNIRQLDLGDVRFQISPNGCVTFPVNAGTTYNINGYLRVYLYT